MEVQWHDSLALQLIGLFLILLGIALARKIINVFPSVMGCFLRSKECFNLEDSALLGRDRNVVAVFCIPVVCFVAMAFKLWNPRFLCCLNLVQYFFVILGVILLYIAIRELLSFAFRPKKVSRREFDVSRNEFYTFLIAATLLSCFSLAVLSLAKVDPNISRLTLYCEFGLVYLIHFVRKGQILASFSSGFGTILYLCALEILPTAALIAPAIFL